MAGGKGAFCSRMGGFRSRLGGSKAAAWGVVICHVCFRYAKHAPRAAPPIDGRNDHLDDGKQHHPSGG